MFVLVCINILFNCVRCVRKPYPYTIASYIGEADMFLECCFRTLGRVRYLLQWIHRVYGLIVSMDNLPICPRFYIVNLNTSKGHFAALTLIDITFFSRHRRKMSKSFPLTVVGSFDLRLKNEKFFLFISFLYKIMVHQIQVQKTVKKNRYPQAQLLLHGP